MVDCNTQLQLSRLYCLRMGEGSGDHSVNLTFVSGWLGKLEGRAWKREGRERRSRSRSRGEEDTKEGRGERDGWRSREEEGRGDGEEGEEELAIGYLLRLPAPPAPPSLGTFCCGPSTSCA